MTTRRIAPSRGPSRDPVVEPFGGLLYVTPGAVWALCEVASSGRVLLQELDRVADGGDGLRGIVRALAAKLLLEGHDPLDGVEAVGPQAVDEEFGCEIP